jgi:hypothetical protein
VGVQDHCEPDLTVGSLTRKQTQDTRNMTKSPEGCGVLEHPPDCLCDVHITKPTTTKLAIPHEMLHGEALAHFGKWDGTLHHWFELASFAWDNIWKFRANQPVIDNRGRYARGLNDDVYAYLVQRIREGGQPTPVRQEIIDRFNVTINKSYVTKLRQRLAQRGEL